MVNWNRLKPILLLGLACLIYNVMMETRNLENFVPYNSFEVPTNLTGKEWQTLNDKFGTLVQLVNTTQFSVAFQMEDMINAFATILNNMGVGKFTILSVGGSSPLTLTDVLVQDFNTLAVTRFKRVDFVVEAVNPFVIHKVIITPDPQFLASQNILPRDKLAPSMFRIQNPLRLFYPYPTSDDDMRLTPTDKQLFATTMSEKATQLGTMATQDAVPIGTVATLPAMALPAASEMSKDIVGAGPLHPVGL